MAPRGVKLSVVLSGSGAQILRLPVAKCSLRVKWTAEGQVEGHPPRALILRQGKRLISNRILVAETLIELAEPGRYEVDVDGLDYGSVEVKAGEVTTFEVGGPSSVKCELRLMSAAGSLEGVEVQVSAQDPRPSEASPQVWRGQAGRGRTDAQGQVALALQVGGGAREVFVSVVVAGDESVFRLPLGADGVVAATLRLRAERRGRVQVDAAAVGGAGARVELKPLTALTARNQVTTLDERGAAVFSGVRPGRYRVTVLGGVPASVEVDVSSAGARAVLSGD
ncbi:MAG: hypothetical protein JKY65_11730 [Planctomycetes bacterium]|nr:hypothetical protein [Planctomycetota bacterium]